MPPDWSRGRTLSSSARGDTTEHHGTLQRLLGVGPSTVSVPRRVKRSYSRNFLMRYMPIRYAPATIRTPNGMRMIATPTSVSGTHCRAIAAQIIPATTQRVPLTRLEFSADS